MPGEATGGTPGVVRSSRLLKTFTLRTLKGGTKPNPTAPPPPVSLAGEDAGRLREAKRRIHGVIRRRYPTCRRLVGITGGYGDSGDDGAGSGGADAGDGAGSGESTTRVGGTPKEPIIVRGGGALKEPMKRDRGPEDPGSRKRASTTRVGGAPKEPIREDRGPEDPGSGKGKSQRGTKGRQTR